MFYVYILKSVNFDEIYTGFTINLKDRLAQHNRGESKHTSKFAPWTVTSYHAFASESVARKFEAYLKSGSGRAFATRHHLVVSDKDS
jgi:putative endonuclease